ncbi:MAG: hypothetical protein GY928_24750 [Colwellia sp.]|nr:hypothetical protein [Colwellia sp.]
MAKKQYFFIVDTETTIKHHVADFAGIVVDRKGKVYNQIAVLVAGFYGAEKLFYNKNAPEEIWTLKGLEKRNKRYIEMLDNGERMLSSVNAINRWISQAKQTYPNLIFSAYNTAFDLDKMSRTGIDTDFANYFCIMRAAQNDVKGRKDYIQHCLNAKWLTAKLQFRTNAEAMAEYVIGGQLPPEPHTALEDIMDYELPIFNWLLRRNSWKHYSQQAYNWREWQLNQLVLPK